MRVMRMMCLNQPKLVFHGQAANQNNLVVVVVVVVCYHHWIWHALLRRCPHTDIDHFGECLAVCVCSPVQMCECVPVDSLSLSLSPLADTEQSADSIDCLSKHWLQQQQLSPSMLLSTGSRVALCAWD